MTGVAPLDRAEMVRTRHRVTDGGCWEWTGYVNRHLGYGIVARNELAHRVSYEAFVGPVANGHHVHHECGNRRCVNPEHLRAVSPLEHSHEHRATAACPRCGSTRRRQMFKSNGKPNGRRCMDCHSRSETRGGAGSVPGRGRRHEAHLSA